MTITHRSGVAEEMEEKAERCKRGPDRRTDQKVYDAVVKANESANFEPTHPKSIIDVRGFWGRIGAKHPRGSYVNALWVPTQIIAGIWKDYMTKGDSE